MVPRGLVFLQEAPYAALLLASRAKLGTIPYMYASVVILTSSPLRPYFPRLPSLNDDGIECAGDVQLRSGSPCNRLGDDALAAVLLHHGYEETGADVLLSGVGHACIMRHARALVKPYL